ncbi:TPA: tail fiber domain-containing protein [Citrobacter freundii]|uniref:tail fiber/spike domain-containing protein n=1 Tax=Citrobacter freundii TaxID=546 RepID=UPI00295DDD0D|nr:tail fiber domain-containing protein [Citrobacter freundii]
MTKYATMNPLGSTSPYDLFDNAQNFDTAINSITAAIWQDRLGRSRHTWHGIEALAKAAIAAFGYITMDSFQAGATLTLPNQVLRDTSTGEYYRWDGSFLPSGKIVPPGSTPANSGGISIGAWLSVGDASLRSSLSDPSHGDAMLAAQQPFAGSVPETQHGINAKRIDALNAGAVGDAIVDDTAAFDILEAQSEYTVIDGLWRTYLVTSYPTRHRYINTTFLIAGVAIRGNGYFKGATRNTNVIVGDGAGENLPANPATLGSGNVAIGEEAMKSGVENRSSIAIGRRAMVNSTNGRYNIAVGFEAMTNVNADGSDFGGTRNVAVGDNSGRFISNGYQNVVMGRNAGQCITSGARMVAIGNNALAGRGSLKFQDSDTIVVQTPFTHTDVTAVGESALYYGGGLSCTGIGRKALGVAKSNSANCTAIGATALSQLGSTSSQDGKVSVIDERTGTFIMTGTTVTFTLAAHGLTTGWQVVVRMVNPGTTYSDPQYYTITVVDDSTFTASEPLALNGYSGPFTLDSYSTLADQASCTNNTAIGTGAMYGVITGNDNIGIGINSNAVNTGGVNNVSIGNLSMRYAVGGSNNTAVGHAALRQMQDGSYATTLTNCTGIGRNAAVSGNNQAQIGDSAVTTYVFGTVQTRSDDRDKADKREIDAGLAVSFIRGLTSYFYKFDYRDDYFEEYAVQIGIDDNAQPVYETRRRPLTKDGSKIRVRDHAGYLAQEVKGLMDSLGIDFGMYQDHLVNGGCDVKTLGYEQVIPFATKAIDVAFNRIDDLAKKQTDLENELKKMKAAIQMGK